MDLAIHILTAACMVGAGVALVFLYKLVYQLEVIIERMNRRIDAMKDYEEVFGAIAEKLNKVPAPAPKKDPKDRTIFDDMVDSIREAIKSPNIKVEGGEKPLDFPNDRKD